MYEFILFLHIVAGMAWVGSGIFVQVQLNRLRAVEGPAAVADQFDKVGLVEKFIFIPAPILVILTGIYMVVTSGAWAFSQLWIVAAIVLFVLSGILGGGVGGKLMKEIAVTRANGGDAAPLVARMLRVSWIDLAVLLLIVAMMVFKPGV